VALREKRNRAATLVEHVGSGFAAGVVARLEF
jgi:hypothetical protein